MNEIKVDLSKMFDGLRRVIMNPRPWFGRIIISVQKGHVVNLKVEESINLKKFSEDEEVDG